MLKGYVNRWKKRDKPEEHVMDYWFCSRAENAAVWDTREGAENDCVLFNHHRIVIPSSEGGTYICRDFKVEERAPGEFVVFCMAPFVPKENSSGESSNREQFARSPACYVGTNVGTETKIKLLTL